MPDDILIRFRTDSAGLKAEFDEISAKLRQTSLEEKKAGDQAKVTSKDIADAAGRRKVLLNAEIALLKQYEQQQKKAFTPKDIAEFNSKITQSQKNISLLKGEQDKLGSGNNLLGQSFAKLGGLIAAAFSVTQLIAFGQESVKSFQVQEKAIAQLRTALKNVAGEGEEAVSRLIGQSEELQRKGIFSDEQINQTQKALIQFGLSARQTEQLTERIADFAATQNESIEESTNTFLRALEGQSRGLIVAGAKFKDTGTTIGNFNAVLESTEKFAGGSADALENAAGKAQNVANRIDDIKERIGENLQPATLLFAEFKLGLTEVAAAFIDFFRQIKDQGKVSTSTITFDDIIKQRIDNIKREFESLPEKALKEIQRVDAILLETATGKQRERFADEIKAIDQLIEERKKQGEFEKDLNKSFATFSDERIKKEIESLNNSTLANSIAVKDRIKLLEAELVKRKELSEKQLEINKQALEQAAQINAQADSDDRARLIKKADADIAQIKATGEAKATLEKAIREKLATDLAKFDKDLAEKTSKQNLQEILAAIDLETQKSIDAQQAKFTAIGNLSKEATEKNQKEISKITIEAEILKDREILALTNLTAAERLAAEKKLLEDLAKLRKEEVKDVEENENQKLLAILDAIGQVSNEINSLLQANSDAEVERIEHRRETNNKAIDEQIAKLEEQHERGRIGDADFERRKLVLINQRAAAEKKYNDQVKKEKQEQAKIDKAIAIFNIILNTARAVATALATPPAPNVFLAAIAGALGAVQLGVAIATPIPAFAQGTKGKQGSGLALVGEKGAELTYLPTGAKVLPAQKTKQYSDVIDSMFDGKLDAYIHKNYVLPALKQTVVVNNGFNEKKLAKLIKQRSSVSIDNLHELAEMFDHNPRRVI